MSARIALPTLILAATAAFLSPRLSMAGAWGLAPGEWYANVEGGALSTTTFYDASGTRADLGGTVEQRALASANEMGWKHGITILYGLPALSVTQRYPGIQGTATGQGVPAGTIRGSTRRNPP